MTTTDANPPLPEFSDEYQLITVSGDWLLNAVRPKTFIHIDQSECILCEGCVDICPWKCIHLVSTDAIDNSAGELIGVDPTDQSIFIIDEDACTRCKLCVDRCPTGVISLGTIENDAVGDPHVRDSNHGYAYGLRL